MKLKLYNQQLVILIHDQKQYSNDLMLNFGQVYAEKALRGSESIMHSCYSLRQISTKPTFNVIYS